MKKKTENYYIDKQEFYNDLLEYKQKCKEAEQNNEEIPPISNKLGSYFIKLAYNISRAANFSGYSYIDEMRSDGIENCMTAVHSFDPEKSKNPFGYFTTTIWFAFVRRIEKEKKQTYIKYKSLVNAVVDGTIVEGDSEHYDSSRAQLDNEKMKPIVEKFEKKNKKKQKPKGVENYMENDNERQ